MVWTLGFVWFHRPAGSSAEKDHCWWQWGPYATTTTTTPWTTTKNTSSRLCDHFPIIATSAACKMCSNCPGIKLEWTELISSATTEKKSALVVHKYLIISSFQVVVLTTTTKKCTEIRNTRAVRAKLLFFFSLIMQVYGDFVLVVLVVALSPYWRTFRQPELKSSSKWIVYGQFNVRYFCLRLTRRLVSLLSRDTIGSRDSKSDC